MSGLLFKLSCSLSLFNVYCIGYPVNFSIVKIGVLRDIVKVFVKSSDYGEKGGSGVVLNNPNTKVDEIAV